MVDALFGSKTRVKLLKLFLNNPSSSYFVREITRLIDEQINSVRRELSNMLKIGIITSESVDNKLFYKVNQKYPYFIPLRVIFSEEEILLTENSQIQIEQSEQVKQVGSSVKSSTVTFSAASSDPQVKYYNKTFEGLSGTHAIVVAGKLVRGSASPIDVLIVGQVPNAKLKSIIKSIERREDTDINYTVLAPEEFHYRMSVRDRFIGEILDTKYTIIKDANRIITGGKK